MGTKREELDKMARGEGVLGKADPDEPIFILRAQDALAGELVELWALRARAASCSNDKVQEAFAISEQMFRWHTRKNPD